MTGLDVSAAPPESSGNAWDAHAKLFKDSPFPSAAACATCHQSHYEEWSVSQHAYAQLSPVFNAMQAKVTQLTSGTNGDFCIRCHTQTGMAMGEETFMSVMDRHPVSQEGITCITCHRMEESYGKISGRFAIRQGGLDAPINGPTGPSELQRALSDPNYRLGDKDSPASREVHGDIKPFFQMTTSGFCGTCHDVTLPNGFRLEEAFSQFKNSPAAHRGESCQDCHMGTDPGVKSPYRLEPAAIVGGMPTKPRKRTNHMFVGPDYSIVHPGIFPHSPQAKEMASMREWLEFDHEAGWGTEAFEDNLPSDTEFPSRWKTPDDRFDARKIINQQVALLEKAKEQRLQLLKRGYQLGDLTIKRASKRGLDFEVEVRNGSDGHNVPTGFDAERVVFLRVTITDADGKVLMQSGDLDPDGDLRDSHSEFVRNGDLPLDKQLFSLQSKFLTTNVRGSEREQVLAVNHSVDPLPFIRPEPFSSILTGRPNGLRIHRRGIPPNGSRTARYKVSRRQISETPPYKIRIQLIAGMVPVNLVKEIQSVGFDFNMSAAQVASNIVDGHMILWDKTFKTGETSDRLTVDLNTLPDHPRASKTSTANHDG